MRIVVFGLAISLLPSAFADALTGRIVDTNQRPVPGAFVAALDGATLLATARTDTAGEFHVDAARATSVAVTAASLACGRRAVAPDNTTPLLLMLAPAALSIQGTVRDPQGRPIADARVAATPSARVAFCYALSDAAGQYRLDLDAGEYRVAAEADNRDASDAERIDQARPRADFTLWPALAPGPAPRAVTRWLDKTARPIHSIDPLTVDGDIDAIADALADAQLIGLGEGAPGTHELPALAQRLIPRLAEKNGLKILVLVAGYAECLALNNYVLNAQGDAQALVSRLGARFDSDEMLTLVESVRAYNADPAHRRIEIYGIDMVRAPLAVAYVRDYLTKVDPGVARSIVDGLAPLASDDARRGYLALAGHARARLATVVAQLIARFDGEHGRYVSRSSEAEWVLARQSAVTLAEHLRFLDSGGDATVRERALGDNMAWMVTQAPPETRMLLWAPNAQLDVHARDGRETLGARLRKLLGARFVSIGALFDRGLVRARDPAQPLLPPRLVTLPSLPPGSLSATLAPRALAFVDLRRAPAPVADWLAHPLATWQVDAAVSDPPQPTRLVPAHSFDALLFFPTIRAARPLAEPFPQAAGAVNVDYERGQPGQLPPGWHVTGAQASFYRLTTTTEKSHAGKKSALLMPNNRVSDNTWAATMQSIDAGPYRGQRVRLRTFLRFEPADYDDDKRDWTTLWLRVDCNGEHRSCFMSNSRPTNLRGTSWARYDIIGEVPDAAERISFGAILNGNGRLFIDDASIDVLGPARGSDALQ